MSSVDGSRGIRVYSKYFFLPLQRGENGYDRYFRSKSAGEKNTRCAMQGMLDQLLRQQGLSAVPPEVAVLLGFAVVFYTLGILRFRYE